MVHRFDKKKGKHLLTTNIGIEEIDVFKIGKKIIAFMGGTDTPVRVWNNKKDFEFSMKLANLKSMMF